MIRSKFMLTGVIIFAIIVVMVSVGEVAQTTIVNVYVGGYSWSHGNTNGVQRSVDGGETFRTLTTNTDGNSIVSAGTSGGWEPYDLIVHPITGEL